MSASPRELVGRLDALGGVLGEAGVDAAIVTHPPCVRYLTGFSGSSGHVYYPPAGDPVLITDFRYEQQAGEEIPDSVALHISSEGWIAALADLVGDGPDLTVAFEPESLTVLEHDRLVDRVEAFDLIGVKRLVAGLRSIKSDSEIESITAAARVAETALAALLGAVDWHAAPTEVEIAARLEYELRRAGSEGLPFDVIVATGPRTSLPHASPADRPVEEGDFVLVDFGATVDGYCSDITRTFVVGEPRDWQLDIHARVLGAQAAALEAIGPGVAGVDVDRAARDHLAAHDLDGYFGHSTGHGIGLEVHEEPRLSTRSEDVLERGNVVTVEPGVYLPGRGGVRIEDDVAITSDGSRVLTSASRDLVRL